jgi:glycerate kinase
VAPENLKVVIAPSAFKGSLSAMEVAKSLGEGVKWVWPKARIELLPVSDGGEEWVQSMVSAADGSFVDAQVRGPLGEPVEARYGMIEPDGTTTAVIEMAAASGLTLVPKDGLDPRRATTYGTGELMLHALDHGAQRLLIGIGGSATNDGGAGMASALGVRFLDCRERALAAGGAALAELASVDLSRLDPRVREADVVVASDVSNPLLGEDGASAVYGPQKGANAEVVKELDAALARFADVVEDAVGRRVRDEAGAGAAGGLGFGLKALCEAELRPGVDLALDSLGADGVLEGASLVITAEGRLDSQTLAGKVPVGVARRARRHGVPVVAVGGAVHPLERSVARRFVEDGIDVICPSAEGPASEDELMDPGATRRRLERAGERIAGLVDLGIRVSGASV